MPMWEVMQSAEMTAKPRQSALFGGNGLCHQIYAVLQTHGFISGDLAQLAGAHGSKQASQLNRKLRCELQAAG